MSFSQQRCGTTDYINHLKENNPELINQRLLFEKENDAWSPNNLESIITIPTVVHIVWRTNSQNLSTQQIESQIDVLNQDFRRLNIDSVNTPNAFNLVAADCGIEFCLATTDPLGNPTNGIVYVQTTETSFNMWNDGMKHSNMGGSDAWDTDRYLNIWGCNLSGSLLGYATMPGWGNSSEDGVVIGYQYFGYLGSSQAPYNKGRTTTHEVGHWLNLDHTWGDNNCGNDQVADTPTQEEENYGCPNFPANINSCNTTNPNGDMFMNYMDYTNDGCMNMFTQGQKSRMVSAINVYRSQILNSTICDSLTTSITETEMITNIKDNKIFDILGREWKCDFIDLPPGIYIINNNKIFKIKGQK